MMTGRLLLIRMFRQTPMTRVIRQMAIALFLVAGATTTWPVPVQAADCSGFFNNCQVSPQPPDGFVFVCDQGVTCNQIDACFQEAGCGAGSTLACFEQYGSGPWGSGICFH